ncbi:MAG: GNAT family N-acetyltransferase [Synergistaceae bacterium]|nr:GNAT family N-acetyltransferase [Synergistaceae bacterium]
MSVIWEDLKFFLKRLKSLPVSESLRLGDEGFCVSTGCEFENWIYYPEKIVDVNLVNEAVKFFKERNMSFMWPIYDGGGEVLRSSGLYHAGELTAMSLNPNKAVKPALNSSVKIRSAEKIPDEWAKTVWRAFEYEGDEVSREYYDLVEAFNNDRESFSLYIAELDGEFAGTFLLTHEKFLSGVYYFGVIPELRRKKVAASMMNEICRLSQGKTITLQATPAGVPFYESFGFERLFAMPIYSNEMNVF